MVSVMKQRGYPFVIQGALLVWKLPITPFAEPTAAGMS